MTLAAIKGNELTGTQRKHQILLVEDDRDVREVLKIILEHAGYAVIAVEDGQAAHEVLQTTSCAVLVTDFNLPDTHGNAIVKQAQIYQPGIATVLISAEPGVEYLAHQCGAHAWYRKGDMLECLIAAITSAFRACTAAIEPSPYLSV